jgi:hypothetical protein
VSDDVVNLALLGGGFADVHGPRRV